MRSSNGLEVNLARSILAMKIYRNGANRYMGTTTLVHGSRRDGVDARQSVWISDNDDLEVQVNARSVSTLHLQGSYNYSVHLTLTDIYQILTELANKGLEKMPNEIAEALEPARASLLRLLLCTEGYESKPRTEPE